MSFPFYRFFPGDYMRDTMHLGWYEDLAYRRLIDLYLLHGKPIRNDRAYLLRAVRAFEPEQQAAVDMVLAEMFELRADGWHQKRCDAEVDRQRERSATATELAKRRWDAKAMPRHSEGICDGNANQNQNQNQNYTKAKTKPAPSASLPADLACSADLWEQFRETRKAQRAPMTARAESLLAKRLQEMVAEGQDAAKVVEQSIERGWKGLFPVDGVKSQRGGRREPTLAEKRAANWADICGLRKHDPDGVGGKVVSEADGYVREQDGVHVGRLPKG